LRPGELIRLVGDRQQQATAARRYTTVLVIDTVVLALAVVGLVQFPQFSVHMVIAIALAMLGLLVYGMLAASARKTSKWTGDDLIDLIVVPAGFVVQGGLEINWSEVLKVEVVQYVPRQQRGTSAVAVGSALAQRLVQHDGANIGVRLHLHDCKAAMNRATSRAQKLTLIDDIGGKGGFANCALGLRPAADMAVLLPILQRETGARGIPIEYTAI
jgi:hypothetical protein